MTAGLPATEPPRTVAVVICSFKRPDGLLRALDSLRVQQEPPHEVLVVAQGRDAPTLAALDARPDDGLPIRRVIVDRPGLVHARNAGLAALRSDVVAFTDDDTATWPDWLARIMAHFRADPCLGGLGGRDWVHEDGRRQEGTAETVGRVQWFGRVIGNHHLGHGGLRPVDVLKGANMSFRTAAIRDLRFDARLRGRGAMPDDDMTFSLAVKRSGWGVAYDPAVALEHFSGEREEPRHYSGYMRSFDGPGLFDFAHNQSVALLSGLPSLPRRLAFLAWSAAVGTKVAPGFLQAVLLTRKLGWLSWRRYAVVQRGKAAGLWTVLRRRRP